MELGGRAPFLGTLKASKKCQRKALEMEQISHYKGCVRGSWKEGCNTEASERHTMEGSGKAPFLLQGSIKGNLRHLARESSANIFIGLESCT